MMKGGILAAIIAVVLVLFLVLSGAFYTVDQTRHCDRVCISRYPSCKT